MELNSAARPQTETDFSFFLFFTFLRMKTFTSAADATLCALQKATITVSLLVHMVTTLRHCCSVTLLRLSRSPLRSFPITAYPALQLIGGRSLSQLSDGEGGRGGGVAPWTSRHFIAGVNLFQHCHLVVIMGRKKFLNEPFWCSLYPEEVQRAVSIIFSRPL